MPSLPTSLRLSGRSYVVWQLSTFALTLLVAAGVMGLGDPGIVGWPTYTGVALLTLSSAVALLVHSRHLSPRWRITVPVLSLLALVVMGVDILSVMPAAAFVVTIPLLWLVFGFGRRGTALALVALLAVLTLIYTVDVVPSGSGPAWMQFLPIPLGGIGLLLGAHQIAAALEHREQRLVEQTRELRTTLDDSQDQLLLLQGLLDTVDAMIVAYDHDGRLIWDNPDARHLVNRAGIATDGTALPHLHYYGPDRVTTVPEEEWALSRAHRGEEFEQQLAWYGPPGDQVAYMLSSRQIHRADEARYGYVIVGLDITDVLEAIRTREEFLTTVSHELRTPLTSIIGYHELIEDTLEPDSDVAALRMLKIAQRNSQVLLTRVGQLLQASGSGERLELDLRSVDLGELIEAVLAKHYPAAATQGLRLSHRVQSGLKGELDPHKFEQVVDNLVTNALKYTPEPGSVTVTMEQKGKGLVLQVIDTGVGMSPAEQRHVFERFYRAASSNEQAIQGLGVGLGVVKAIVEAHGGEVLLRSRPGLGTEVRVTLPGART